MALPQGTLNRLKGAVNVSTYPSLNVIADNLAEDGVSLSFEGDVTDMINTLTGRVTSPSVYVGATMTINLLKTQNLASLYKAQMESLSTIGDVVFYSDSSTLPSYSLTNCSIQRVNEITANGKDAKFSVTIGGTYLVNQKLYTI